jgi:hypothetical protein
MVAAGRWWVVVGYFSLGACAQPAAGPKAATPVTVEARVGGPSDEGAMPMQHAGDYVFRHEHDAEDGCSQSFASASDRAVFALHVGPGGEAKLSLAVDHTSTFGPSPGRYVAGDRDFSYRRGKRRFTWSGKAVFDGVWLRAKLDREEATCVELPPYGEEGTDVPCGGIAEAVLACEEVTMETDVPGSSDERSGPRVVALRCQGKLGLDTIVPKEIAEGELLFAPKPGLVMRTGRGMWEQRRTVQVAEE